MRLMLVLLLLFAMVPVDVTSVRQISSAEGDYIEETVTGNEEMSPERERFINVCGAVYLVVVYTVSAAGLLGLAGNKKRKLR